MTTDAEFEERLNKHAAAITRLRRDRDDLKAAVAALTEQMAALTGSGATSSTVAPVMAATWTPLPTCAMCDKPKEPGRKTLTCGSCAARRQKIISTPGSDRSPIMRDSCFRCGERFTASSRFLCTPCSAAFKLWKATA